MNYRTYTKTNANKGAQLSHTYGRAFILMPNELFVRVFPYCKLQWRRRGAEVILAWDEVLGAVRERKRQFTERVRGGRIAR